MSVGQSLKNLRRINYKKIKRDGTSKKKTIKNTYGETSYTRQGSRSYTSEVCELR